MPRPVRSLPPLTLERNGRLLWLSYNQDLERGPSNYTEKSIDPSYILDIADHGKFTGLVLQKGVASAYYKAGKNRVPLIVQLNSRAGLTTETNDYATMVCTVAEALDLGAKAVGYSIYLGSAREGQMMSELSEVVRDAHERHIPVIAWMTFSSDRVEPTHRDILAYAARIALELGVDYVQLAHPGNVADLAWVVESAGTCKVVCSVEADKGLHEAGWLARSVLQAGGAGLVVGKSVWQAKDPLVAAQSLSTIIWREGGRPHVEI